MKTVERPLNTDPEIIELLPDRADLFAVADAVAATQSVRRRRPTKALISAAVALAAIGLTVALVGTLGSNGGLTERALAAVGGGRVLHTVVRVQPQGTAIDLSTGRRARIYAVLEQWYEPGSGLHQRVLRSNGALEPGRLPLSQGVFPQYATLLENFGRDYRDALRSGDAQTERSTVLAGRRVHWLRFDPAGNQPDYEVAVDAETHLPVAAQQVGLPHSRSEILSVDTVGTVPSSARSAPPPNATMFGIERTGSLDLGESSTFMERPAFWLGESHAGLPLNWLGGLVYSLGNAERWSEIKNHWRGIELVYGATNEFGIPERTKPYLRIEQGTQSTGLGGTPPEGTLVSYGRLGVAQKDGVFIVIEASDPALVLSSAEALVSVPPR
jgi:hypothetical protein